MRNLIDVLSFSFDFVIKPQAGQAIITGWLTYLTGLITRWIGFSSTLMSWWDWIDIQMERENLQWICGNNHQISRICDWFDNRSTWTEDTSY
jgi:hypothetical protein